MADAEARTGARRRTPWLVALGVGAAVLLLLAAAVAQRRAIARSLIDAQLRALGLEEVGQEVERFGLAEFGVRDLRIGSEGDLVVERIDARYSLSSLMAGRLEELSVRGVRLRGRVEESGLSFGALDPLLENRGGGGESRSPLAALPAANVAIEDAQVRIETPQGPLATSFEARASDVGGGIIEARASLTAQHPHAAAAARIDVRGTAEAFEGDAIFELTAGGAIAPGAELEPTAISLLAGFAYADERMEVDVAPTQFAVAVRRADETFRAAGETPALSLSLPPTSGGPSRGLHVATAGGQLRLPDYDFEARGIAVDGELDPETGLPSGTLRVEALVDTHEPPRVRKLALDGTLAASAARMGFDVTAASRDRHLELSFRGTHDFATGRGEAQLKMKPVEFAPDGLQPAALSPLLGRSIESASGGVEALGAIAWGGGEALRGGVDVALRDLSVSSDEGGFERLNAALRVTGPWPLATPPDQLVSMARVDFGLELTNGLVDFQIRPGGVLDIASAEWSFAGGKIRTRGATDLTAETQALTLKLEDVDLSKLLVLVDLEGLSGSGLLEGKIPVVRHGSTLEIRNGRLSSTQEGGWIRYHAAPGLAAAVGRQAGFDVTLAALENFHYDELIATVNGDTAGPVQVSVRLVGKNPERFRDRPVDFTLNLESHLVDLLRKATAVYRIPEEIEKRLQEISERPLRGRATSGGAEAPALDAEGRAR
jgi:hypothetical protein